MGVVVVVVVEEEEIEDVGITGSILQRKGGRRGREETKVSCGRKNTAVLRVVCTVSGLGETRGFEEARRANIGRVRQRRNIGIDRGRKREAERDGSTRWPSWTKRAAKLRR